MRGRAFGDSGFTFLETIISIALITMVFAALSPLVVRSTMSLARLSKDSRTLYEISRVYEEFRSDCRSTTCDPWSSSAQMIRTNAGVSIIGEKTPGADGAWRVLVGNDSLTIQDGKGQRKCYVTGARLQALTLNAKTVGLQIDFIALNRKWHWSEHFASAGY